MKKEFLKVIAVYLFLSIIFFLPLFYPEPHLFVTPDFGKSDIWNFNYPFKNFFSEFLKMGEWPLWSKDIGAGFPILAEGQIGAFHPFNIILFRVFPTWMAFNLSYIFIFIFSAIGGYLFSRDMKIERYVSAIGGGIFAFSGYNIVQINHINLLLASAHLPWIFLAASNLIKRRNFPSVIFLSIILSLQLFSGFPQMSFITVIAITLYLIFHLQNKEKREIIKILLFFGFSLFLTALLSAMQLLPTLELINNSSRREGLDIFSSTSFPYPLKHLLSFINPFILGNPKYGSYPPFSINWGIFWENTSYIGLLPIVFFVIALINKKTRRQLFFWIVLLLISFFLMLGKNSPLYFVYSFPLFSIFRVPSRFLLIFTFSIIIISTFGLEVIEKFLVQRLSKNFLKLANFIIATIIAGNVFIVWKDYHPIGKVSEWLSPPENSIYLKEVDSKRIITLPIVTKSWNEVFLTHGWQNPQTYKGFREDLNANINMLFGIPSLTLYGAFLSSRQALVEQLSHNFTQNQDGSLNVGTISAKLNDIFSVDHIISSYKINNERFELEKVQKEPTVTFYIYKNPESLPRIRFVTNVVNVQTVQDIENNLENTSYDIANSVMLENGESKKGQNPKYSIHLEKETNTNIVIKATVNTDGYLILADTYYPGWKAYVDGKEKSILVANLGQRALNLEPGEHTIVFNYNPDSLRIGLLISNITALVIIICSMVYYFLLKRKSKAGYISSLFPYRESNL